MPLHISAPKKRTEWFQSVLFVNPRFLLKTYECIPQCASVVSAKAGINFDLSKKDLVEKNDWCILETREKNEEKRVNPGILLI